jgi:hydroxypyruvate reductase
MRGLTRSAAGKPTVVLVVPILPSMLETLEKEFTVFRLWEAPESNAALASWADSAQALVTSADGPVDARLLDALPNLKIVSTMSTGLDHIDLDAARAGGIAVTNTPEVTADAVADLAIALVLHVAYQIAPGRHSACAHGSLDALPPPRRSLAGTCVGIVGLGCVGLAFARRAQAFGMRISYYEPRRKPDVGYAYCSDLEVLARHVDYLVITAPGGAATRHLVDAHVLAALGSAGTLINVGRGSIVDERALIDALSDGTLGAAALDVFAHEPHVPHELRALDSVVLLPHVGSATLEARAAMAQLVVDNLRAYFAGKVLLTPVVQT